MRAPTFFLVWTLKLHLKIKLIFFIIYIGWFFVCQESLNLTCLLAAVAIMCCRLQTQQGWREALESTHAPPQDGLFAAPRAPQGKKTKSVKFQFAHSQRQSIFMKELRLEKNAILSRRCPFQRRCIWLEWGWNITRPHAGKSTYFVMQWRLQWLI